MSTQYLEQQRLTTPERETEAQSQSTPHVRGRIASFVVTVQLILLVAHWFVYQTWMSFRPDPDPPGATALQFQVGYPGISAALLSGQTDRFDVGGRFSFLFLSQRWRWRFCCVDWAHRSVLKPERDAG